MYYAVEKSNITKLPDHGAALSFVRKGVNSETEIYRMPRGWRGPKPLDPEIIVRQGTAMDVHFRRNATV